MIGLVPAELKRQTGRKASFFGAIIWVLLFGVGTFVWALVGKNPTSTVAIENGGGLILFATTLAAIVLGATAGAYDVDQGTMRYLVLTGRPRWQLVVVRIVAFPITVILFSLPGMVLVVLAGLFAGGEPATGELYLDLFYGPFMAGVLYGTLSLCIGTFLKSNGVAIAVAVLLNFGGFLIAGLIYEFVSEDLGNGFYPIVAAVVVDREATGGADATLSLGTSIVVLLVWLFALIGASIARVQRAEY